VDKRIGAGLTKLFPFERLSNRRHHLSRPGEFGRLLDQGTRLRDAVKLRINNGNAFGTCCSGESFIGDQTDELTVVLS
jgi:hypothetical protein